MTTALPQPSTKRDEVSKDTEAPKPQVSKLTENLEAWVNGGMLYMYDRFTGWLADLARSFIDWQSHGIHRLKCVSM